MQEEKNIEDMSLSELMLELHASAYCIRREANEQLNDDNYSSENYRDDVESRANVIFEKSEQILSMLEALGEKIPLEAAF